MFIVHDHFERIVDALEKKYKTEDLCLKKFVVTMFLEYKMVDTKNIGLEVQELQLIFHDLITEDMVVNETFQVATMLQQYLLHGMTSRII